MVNATLAALALVVVVLVVLEVLVNSPRMFKLKHKV